MTDTAPTAASDADFLHESRITPIQGLILLLGVVIAMLDGFDIQIIAYTAPAITRDWGVSSQEMGLVFSAGLLGMTLGAMLLSPLADLYGRRIVVSVSLLIAGVTTAVVVYAETVTQLIVLRVLGGLALGTLLSSLPTLVGEYSPRRYRTLIIAILLSGNALGAIVGGLISAAVISSHGWKPIFFVTGVILILSAVAFHLLVPESMSFIAKRRPQAALARINRILAYIGQPTIAQLPATGGDEKQESASVTSLLTPARRAVTLLAWITFFLGFASVYFLYSWVPQVLADSGLSQEQAIQGSVILSIGATIGTVLIGWLARWRQLNGLIAVSFVIGALCMAWFSNALAHPQGVSLAGLQAVLFLIGLTASAAFSNLYSVALTVYPAQVRSTGLGWCIGLGRGGAVISPALAGAMIGLGVTMPALFVYFAAPLFIAALCVRLIKMKELP